MSWTGTAARDASGVDLRVVVSLPGRYRMTRRRGIGGRSPEYACRLVNISPYDMVFSAPVLGSVSEPVTAHFDELGELRGEILRSLYGGFAMSIAASPPERARLATKLAWLDRNKKGDGPEGRRHRRIVPRSPHSTLIFGDATTKPCFVIDLSSSGAAVSAEISPPIGTPLAVGKVVGRVVRHFAEGFAVDFVNILDPRIVEAWSIKPNLTITATEATAAKVLQFGDVIAFDVGSPAP